MARFFNFASLIVSIYMMIITIRIILTWFSGMGRSGLEDFLAGITDPYLNWFRRFRLFKNSPIDFSPIVALAVLSLIHNLLLRWGQMGRISIALVLILILNAFWTVLSWVLGFFIVILFLRMIAFLINANIYSPFWRFVDFIAQPVMFRISRIFFPTRITGYLFRIIFSIAVLVLLGALIWSIVHFGSRLLLFLPI